jgi:hypothetical protein
LVEAQVVAIGIDEVTERDHALHTLWLLHEDPEAQQAIAFCLDVLDPDSKHMSGAASFTLEQLEPASRRDLVLMNAGGRVDAGPDTQDPFVPPLAASISLTGTPTVMLVTFMKTLAHR